MQGNTFCKFSIIYLAISCDFIIIFTDLIVCFARYDTVLYGIVL